MYQEYEYGYITSGKGRWRGEIDLTMVQEFCVSAFFKNFRGSAIITACDGRKITFEGFGPLIRNGREVSYEL